MNKKIFRLVFIGMAIVLFISIMMSASILHYYYVRLHEEEIRTETAYIAAALEVSGEEFLRQYASGELSEAKSESYDVMEEEKGSRMTWIDSDGNVLYDSRMDESELNNHNDREEVIAARKNGFGESVRYSMTLSRRTYNYCVLLNDGSVIRMSTGRGTLIGILFSMYQPLAIIIVLTVVVAVMVSGRISNKVLEPINRINLEEPSMSGVYEELTPLVRRLSNQNMQIQSQIRELKQKQQEFVTMTENMTEGLLVFSREGTIISCNQSALQLLTGVGSHDEKIEEVLDNTDFMKMVQEALKGIREEEKLVLNGRICQIITSPVIQENQAVGCIVMLFDVTRKEENEQFRREFTANVSHELKTPLTSISGFAEIIQNGIARPEDIVKFAGNIYQESQRLIALIGDIINLSRLDENSSLPEKCDCDLQEITQEVICGLEEIAARKNVKLLSETESCVISGIPAILEEMIFNICDNAIKYNHENGSVNIHLYQENDHAILSVEDTGIGIPYEDRERVFERFYRVNKSHSKEIGGTGLGLSIVKHAAIIHDAEITLEGVPGEGTGITVRFPMFDQ